MFVRENVVQFPPRGDVSHDNMERPKELTAVAAVSNAVQCKHAAAILRELAARGPLDKRTAVVLTDENLLLPLLYALPPEIGKVNVTMGYPLRASLAYTFVERLVELQAHRRTKGAGCTFYHADAVGILAHPYVADSDARETRAMQDEIVRERRISVDAAWLGRNDLLRMIFSPAAAWRELSDWLLRVVAAVARTPYEGDDRRQRVEFLAVISEEISKLRNSLDECDIELTTEVYTSLLRRHLQTVRIPYEGEPLEGVQVMGILETRNLDFENVVLLSMNDDNFPGNHMAQASFVPYNLRAAYGLPTPEHHEGVYAYYFYRLVQRARRVWMLYCSHADDKSTGEPSRYIYQLDYESGFPVRKVEVGVDVNLAETDPIEVAKDEGIMQRLGRFTDPESKATLSPTAFFRYVACPLRFYFHSVARLQADDEIAEEVDAPMFGTILHAAVQKLYARIVGEAHPGETLRAMIRTGEIAAAVEAAINENYLQDPAATTDDYTGNLLLVTHDRHLMNSLACPILYLEDGKAVIYPSYDALMGRAAPAPVAEKSSEPAKAGYGKEQRRRRAELRAKIKACEDEMEACGAREVELENEINSPEVYNDPQLLREKSDELSDLRFHQDELFAAWEAAVEEQEQYEQTAGGEE